MMDRAAILAAMDTLRLYGMKGAFDAVITAAVKRQHEPQRVVGDLLTAEIVEKQARSIKYQITIAKLPLAKEIEEFDFVGTPVNESLVRDLAGGDFLAHQRNIVLVGGTGTGKTHLAIAIGGRPDFRLPSTRAGFGQSSSPVAGTALRRGDLLLLEPSQLPSSASRPAIRSLAQSAHQFRRLDRQ